MSKYWLASYLCLFVVATPISWGAEKSDKPMGWQTSFAEAEALARELQLPIVVHFHANWCGPCRTMEQTVLSHAATLELIGSRVIGVKVNSDLHRELVVRFSVSSLPTDIFLDSQGKEVERTVGMLDRTVYLGKIHALSKSTSPAARTNSIPKLPSEDTFSSQREQIVRHVPVTLISPAITQVIQLNSVDTRGIDLMQAVLSRDVDGDGYRRGLGGFSPVSLAMDNSWTTGNREFAAEFRGVRYLLASAKEVQQFLKNPTAYAPSLHGFDPVAIQDQHKLTIGKITFSDSYDQRLFFFACQESREVFRKNPIRYAILRDLQILKQESTVASSQFVN